MSTPSSRGQSIHFDPLEGGIIGDEHRMRRAHIRHREVELEGKRVDARITSLESLATQATLIAGFSYSSIRPDDGAGLLAAHKFTAFVVFVSACLVLLGTARGHRQPRRGLRERFGEPCSLPNWCLFGALSIFSRAPFVR